MAPVSVVGPDGGESIQLGPTLMRILEDGSTTAHRLGMGEITLAPHTDGPPQHRHARTTRASTSYPGPRGSPLARPPTTRLPEPWS
jgi:hypothetical protein